MSQCKEIKKLGDAEFEKESFLTQLEAVRFFLKLLDGTAEKAEVLCFFAEEVFPVRSLPETGGAEEALDSGWKNWNRLYQPYFAGMLKILMQKKLPKEEFYQHLVKALWDEFYFDASSRIFALQYFFTSTFCPYFELPSGITMTDEEFNRKKRLVEKDFKKLYVIMHQSYNQRTERASLINDIFANYEDAKDRAVLMACFLGQFEKSSRK